MSRVPILCRWLLKAVAPIVPADARKDWEREWYGELWHWIGDRMRAGDTEASRVALSHCAGAIKDAVHLRREDDATWVAVRKVTGSPVAPIAVLLTVIASMALASDGFQRFRRLTGSLPYRAPEQIVVLRQVSPLMGARLGLPLVKVENWKQSKTLDGVAAYAGYHALVETGGRWREAPAAAVDPDFFRVLGVNAASGRLFDKHDETGCGDCVVVSHDFWSDMLGRDAHAIGRSYQLAGRRLRVIGVLPKRFWFFSESPAIWTLINDGAVVDRTTALVYAVARIRPEVERAKVLPDLMDLYWKLPPLRFGRRLEIIDIGSLTHDPVYERLAPAAASLFVVSVLLVCFVPAARVGLRAAAYFVTEAALIALVVSVGAVEFVHASSVRLSGVRGFGPETVSLWLVVVGFVMAIGWAWHDGRKRCRTCLHRLAMPVRMGSRGHVLMDRMSTELVCPTGHGVLWAQEDMLESHPGDRWLKLDETWKDLFAVPEKH